jgi:hypothetical protein
MNAQRVVVARTVPQAGAMYRRHPPGRRSAGNSRARCPCTGHPAVESSCQRRPSLQRRVSWSGIVTPLQACERIHNGGRIQAQLRRWHHTGPVGGAVTLRTSPKAAPRSSTPIAVGVRQRQRRFHERPQVRPAGGQNHVPGPCAGLWTAPGFPHPQHTTTVAVVSTSWCCCPSILAAASKLKANHAREPTE